MVDRLTYSNNISNRSIDKFFSICKRKNYSVVKATRDQDRLEHWDYQINAPKGNKLVDLKSIKDNDPNITYLEFVGITGYDGWLLGKADYILFEQEKGFLSFATPDLLNWSLNKVGVKDVNEIKSYYKNLFTDNGESISVPRYIAGANLFSKNKDFYKLYSREPWRGKPRHDIMTKVKIKDIKKEIKHFVFV